MVAGRGSPGSPGSWWGAGWLTMSDGDDRRGGHGGTGCFGALAYGGRGPRSSSVMSSESSRARSLHRGRSLLAELFPTTVRASVAGWWVAAGVLGAVAAS